MISLTRLNGDRFAVNADLIERAEETPDTVITLTNGTKYVVAETLDELLQKIQLHRAGILALAGRMVDDELPTADRRLRLLAPPPAHLSPPLDDIASHGERRPTIDGVDGGSDDTADCDGAPPGGPTDMGCAVSDRGTSSRTTPSQATPSQAATSAGAPSAAVLGGAVAGGTAVAPLDRRDHQSLPTGVPGPPVGDEPPPAAVTPHRSGLAARWHR